MGFWNNVISKALELVADLAALEIEDGISRIPQMKEALKALQEINNTLID